MVKRRLVIAVISTVLFSLLLATIIYTPMSVRQPNTAYSSFGAPLPFLLLVTGVAYILGGVPVSFLIDKYITKEIMKLPFYVIAGFLVGCLLIAISFGTIAPDVLSYGVFGVGGSLLFFAFIALTNVFGKTRSSNNR